MEFIDDVMSRLAIPEFAQLVKNINISFEQHGFVDHISELEPLETQEGILENQIIVDTVMSIYRTNLLKLLNNLYIDVHEEADIYQLKDLLETVSMLEFSVESEAIIYTYDADLEPLEQLLEWIEVILPERKNLIEETVTNVGETLINNVHTLHELKVPLQSEEVDPLIKDKIQILKFLKSTFPDIQILALNLVKEKGFKYFFSQDEILSTFSEVIKEQENKPVYVTLQLLGLATLLEGPCDTHGETAKQLAENFFQSPMTIMNINDNIVKLINKHGELCTVNKIIS